MTKKDYIALAKALSEAKTVQEAVGNIAAICAADNPRFDLDRFLAACKGK